MYAGARIGHFQGRRKQSMLKCLEGHLHEANFKPIPGKPGGGGRGDRAPNLTKGVATM